MSLERRRLRACGSRGEEVASHRSLSREGGVPRLRRHEREALVGPDLWPRLMPNMPFTECCRCTAASRIGAGCSHAEPCVKPALVFAVQMQGQERSRCACSTTRHILNRVVPGDRRTSWSRKRRT